jgi:hypothetical protein
MATLSGSLGSAGAGTQVYAYRQSAFSRFPVMSDTVNASPDAGPTTADGSGNWSLTVATAEPYYLRFVSGGSTIGWELTLPPVAASGVSIAAGSKVGIGSVDAGVKIGVSAIDPGSSVAIAGTPAVSVSGTPTVNINAGQSLGVSSLPAGSTYPNPAGDVIAPAALQGVVVTGNGALGADIDVSKYTELDVYINCTAVSGTTPTVIVNVDTKSPDAAPVYASIYATSAITAAGLTTQSIGRGCQSNKGFGNTIRIRTASFGGSATPSLTFNIAIIGKYG